MLGNGGLRSLESREDFADAALASREIFEQLKASGIG